MKRFWEWLTRAAGRMRDNFNADIFAVAYAKIIGFYILIGVVITVVAQYVIYHYTTILAQNLVGVVQELLLNPVTPNATMAQLIVTAIGNQIQQINIVIGVWILITVAGCAYLLAKVTLLPIRHAMERQRRFIANIAHELRTPLSVMKTNFEVALLDVEHTTREELLETIATGIDQIDRTTGITKFLLDFSSLEKRQLKTDFSNVNLCDLVRHTVQFMDPLIAGKGINVRTLCDVPVFVRGNPLAIQEMLINLVKNAIAYTPTGGLVTIRATRESYRFALLSVQDTGIGIPEKDLPNIFEPFYRGENAFSQRSQKRGTGLGLAIVKEIAELHKARVSAESELGQGTTIAIHFPAS